MRVKELLKGALLWSLKLALAIVLVLVVAELSVRITYAVRDWKMRDRPQAYMFGHTYTTLPPWIDSTRMVRLDPELIWKMRPGVSHLFVDAFAPAPSNQEWIDVGRAFIPELPPWLEDRPVFEVSLNSEGFRSAEFDEPVPEGTFRIACLGDSWTFGSNLALEDAYCAQLEAQLAARFPGIPFDSVNLGVLGHSSRQGLTVLRNTVDRIDPDLVVIAYGGTDGQPNLGRDEAAVERMQRWRLAISAINVLELPKLVNYVGQRFKKGEVLLGDRLENQSRMAVNIRSRTAEELVEKRVRVPPDQYADNLRGMIRAARERGAEAVLLFNDLAGRPGLFQGLEALYWETASGVAESEGVAIVDGRSIVDDARAAARIEIEERLGLAPAPPPAAATLPGEGREVVFRVWAGDVDVPEAIYIAGADPALGDALPNDVTMHDDGTHGDQRAGDGVWSLAVRLPGGRDVFYVYTNSGREGAWDGVDVPHVREFFLEEGPPGERHYLPVDSFGRLYVQSDSMHPDRYGHGLIADALVDASLRGDVVRQRLGVEDESAPR